VDTLPRFVTLDTVMEVFAISRAQAYALVRSRDLPAIQIGGRGQWRVEVAQLEAYIQRQYRARTTADDDQGPGDGADSTGFDRPRGVPSRG